MLTQISRPVSDLFSGMGAFEIALLLLVIVLALRQLLAVPRVRHATYCLIHSLACKPGLGISVTIAWALFLCVSYALSNGWPHPQIHDEFSYLLAGDTIYHGRLANPTHQCWQHFESFHIVHQPSYASKYPLGQGCAIAIGNLLGHPIFGIWISMAAACGATCWMCQCWLKNHWGLLVGLIGTGRLCTADYPMLTIPEPNYWSQSYWGGAVAMLGGALMLGALGLSKIRVTTRSSIVFGIGISILSHSRPMEGLLVSIPAAIAYLYYWSKLPCPGRQPVVVLLLIGLVNAGLIASHNWAVTGNIWKLPVAHYEQQYALTPLTLLGQGRQEGQPGAPTYRHQVLREFNEGWQLDQFTKQHVWSSYWSERSKKLEQLWSFFIGTCLTLPIIFFLLVKKPIIYWLTVMICALPLGAYVVTPWMHPHYLAPVACLPLLWIGWSIQRLSRLKSVGAAGGFACAIGLLLVDAVLNCDSTYDHRLESNKLLSSANRTELERKLNMSGGKHLVLVRYDPGHYVHHEWVYNRADIDGASVIWARDMGRDNSRLLDYFKDRQITKIAVQSWSFRVIESNERLKVD